MTKTVFGTGLIAADHIYIKKEKKSKPEYFGTSSGGSVGNTLSFLSLLGYRCEIFGVVGNDLTSDIIMSDFEKFGILHSLTKRRGKPSILVRSRQYSHLIDEKKSMHYFKRKCLTCGEDFNREFQFTKKDLTNQVINVAKKSDIIHIDRANGVTVKLALIGNENNVPITVDLGYTQFKRQKIVRDLLTKATLAKLNNKVFVDITGNKGREGLEEWLDSFPNIKTLVVTDGQNGLYGYSIDGFNRFFFNKKAIPCKNVRDQSGAGDILMAALISELVLNNKKKSRDNIILSINRGQAFASLNCSLYGAKALQRTLLKQGLHKNEIFDIADVIIKEGKAWDYFTPKVGLPNEFKYTFRFVPQNACYVCGGIGRTTRKKKQIAKQSVYIVNLGTAFIIMSQAFEKGLRKRNRFENYRGKPILFIGSGGSFSAASFGEQLLIKLYGIPSKAIPPYHFENLKVIESDSPICLLSYGGNNPDIIGAALRIAKAKVENCLVLCGDKESKLADIASKMNWNLIDLPGQERGFVSTIGMLGMVSSLISILVPDNSIDSVRQSFETNNLMGVLRRAEDIATSQSQIIDKASNHLHIVGLASGWGWPALIDFESKLVEGGICTIEISEMKNFTHGRYINLFHNSRNRVIVIFETPEERELSEFLQKKLERFIRPMIIVRTEEEGVSGALELMIKSLYLAWYFGKRKGKDISSPRYPSQARGLYSWEPKYRTNKDLNVLLKEV